MNNEPLEKEIEDFLYDWGVLSIGFATKKSLEGGPSTLDITYPMKNAETAICFALPLDREKTKAFLRKDMPNGRRGHELDNIETNIKAFQIAIKTTNFLKEKGFDAKPVFPNYKYREDVPGWEINMIPELSLKLIAARSGVGSVGWSGNIGIKVYGANIILGCVVTSAKLRASDPIPPEELFCTKCKICQKVCALRMFESDEIDELTIGGFTFSCSKRLNLERCKIVCGGLSGLEKNGKWSTWSPGRYSYPETDKEVMKLLAIAVNNALKWPDDGTEIGLDVNQLEGAEEIMNALGDDKEKLQKMIMDTKLTCGNCQLVCWGDLEQTKENYELLLNSGCVIQNEKGKIEILSSEKAEQEFKSFTSKHQRLYYKNYKKSKK